VPTVNIVGWIVVGLIAGTLASWVTREERRGCIYTLVIGVLGALIGGAIAQAVGSEGLGDFSWRALVIAFLHDAGALTALRHRGADLRIVVIDNDGGGIFSFLPQASALPAERFEQLFGTPHGSDLVAVARAHGVDAATVVTAAELTSRLGQAGPSVTRVATDRAANVALHAAINDAVAAQLR